MYFLPVLTQKIFIIYYIEADVSSEQSKQNFQLACHMEVRLKNLHYKIIPSFISVSAGIFEAPTIKKTMLERLLCSLFTLLNLASILQNCTYQKSWLFSRCFSHSYKTSYLFKIITCFYCYIKT